jgi:hypothetical protein
MSLLVNDGADPDNAMADQDVCVAVGEDLARAYPGYPWMVGTSHKAGTVVIDLGVYKPPHLRNYAYQLYISTILGAGGQKRVMEAGGELLERFGLRRGTAHEDTNEIAAEHGLIIDGHHDKSKTQW